MRALIFNKYVLSIILALLYGILNYWSLALQLPGAAAMVSIRPQIIIPLLGGFLMGPLSGFIIGGFGNYLGDWLNNVSSQYWMFSLGNGIMGAVMGLPVFRIKTGKQKVESASDLSRLLLLIIAANITGIGLGLIIYNLMHSDSISQLTWLYFHPILVSNIFMSYILISPVLFLFRRISGTFDIRLCFSQLYIIIIIVISIVFVVHITESGTIQNHMGAFVSSEVMTKFLEESFLNIFRFGGTIGILVIIISISLAFFLIEVLLKPVNRLMDAAKKLKEGKTDQIDLKDIAENKDALGRLAQIFFEAVGNVRIREERLKSEIEKLHVVIDKEQEDRQVREITESEYFRSLSEKARTIRGMKEKKST